MSDLRLLPLAIMLLFKCGFQSQALAALGLTTTRWKDRQRERGLAGCSAI